MSGEDGLQGVPGMPAENAVPAPVRAGASWRAWVVAIVVAVVLSVTATLMLGGSGAFRQDSAGSGAGSGGCGGACCPPGGK